MKQKAVADMPLGDKSSKESGTCCENLVNPNAEAWFQKGKALYETGNYSAAVNWYRKAADQGNTDAQFKIGICYIGGHGVSQDNLMAFHWINKAAKQGDGDSLCFMGVCYTEGFSGCLQKDFAKAYKYFTHAQKQGHKNAAGWLKLLDAWMSPKELAEGKRLAREFCVETPQINHLL